MNNWERNFIDSDKDKLEKLLKRKLFVNSPAKNIKVLKYQKEDEIEIYSIHNIEVEECKVKSLFLEIPIKIYLNDLKLKSQGTSTNSQDNKDPELEDEYPFTIDLVLTRISQAVVFYLGSNSYRNIPTKIKVKFVKVKLVDRDRQSHNSLHKFWMFFLENNYPAYILGLYKFSYSESILCMTYLYLNRKIDVNTNKDLLTIFNKKVDVLLEEYKTLRQQILTNGSSLTNIFYYGILVIAAIFTAIQSLLSQLNTLTTKLEEISIQAVNTQFRSLYISLLILLLIVLPFVCFIFIFKWLSNSQNNAVTGCYLVKVELEINRAFNKFNIFDDYELRLEWETYLRRMRRNLNNSSITFGNVHIYLVLLFFGFIALLSQIFALFFLNDGTFFNVILFICSWLFCLGFAMSFNYYIDHTAWYLALPNSTINFDKNKSWYRFFNSCKWSIVIWIFYLFLIYFIRHQDVVPTGLYSDDIRKEVIKEIIFNSESQEIKRINLNGIDLTGVNLTGVQLTNAQMEKTKLPGANLTRAKLRGANLKQAVLTAAKLPEANLIDTNFTQADLMGANLKRAIFNDKSIKSVLSACNWDEATFSADIKEKLSVLNAETQKKPDCSEKKSN
jgi:hypothetical protein